MIHKTILSLSIFFIILSPAYTQNLEGQKIDSAFFQSALKNISKGKNSKRYRFTKNFVKKNNLQNLKVKTEAIDWFGLYRNVIVEKKGKSDSIVYIVCHYDKIDGNIFSMLNLLINGNLDIVFSLLNFSKGAYDNGSGLAISLSLLPWVNEHETHYTYRFLYAGMEEYGLRGSRRHISGLDTCEWNRCLYAINIDMVGKKGLNGITVTENVSDKNLVKIAEHTCKQLNLKLNKARMPEGASSDYQFFSGHNFMKDFGMSFLVNFTGALIPQRSYYGEPKKAIPVISFTDDAKISGSEYLSTFSPLAFGEVHSFRDKAKIVSCNNLVDYHDFIKNFMVFIDQP
jgi:hypothetical protein